MLSLIHACNQSTTQNIPTSNEGVFVILNNNYSLPPGSDCCHQNGKTTFSNTVTWTLKNKLEFPILNQLISRKYPRLIDVIFQYRVRALLTKEPTVCNEKCYIVLLWFGTSVFYPYPSGLLHWLWDNRPISKIPECTCSISHNTPFRTEMCTFLFWMEHCGIWNRCILGFMN